MNWRRKTIDESPETALLRIVLNIATILLLILICLGALGVGARLAYRHCKRWRSRHLAAQAEDLMAHEQWAQALDKARAAYETRPGDTAALRALARVWAHRTNAAALQCWHELVRAGEATDAERRNLVELALQVGGLALAKEQALGLVADAPQEPANLWLAAQVFARLGDYGRALDFSTRACAGNPQNQEYRLFLSRLLFDSPEVEQRLQSRSNVWALARTVGGPGLEALRFLCNRPELSFEERSEISALLTKHPLSGTAEELLVLDQSLRLEPQRRQELLAQAQARCAHADAATLRQFAVWLLHHQEFQRVLEILPLERAARNADLFLPYLDALSWLGRWEELDKLLESRESPLVGVHREAYRAHCAMRLGSPLSAAAHWNGALRSAEGNADQLQWLALYAEQSGNLDTARRAYRFLIAHAADRRPVYDALEQLVIKTGSTEQLRQLLEEMLCRWPKDHKLRNDCAYVNLLLSRDLEESRRIAEELTGLFPDSLPVRTTLALACHRANDPVAALRAYAGSAYDWRLALPGNRAVYAAVLAANGQMDAAQAQARGIPRERLRVEEMDLIRALVE